MSKTPVTLGASGAGLPPNKLLILPGKKPDGHPYDDIYVKSYLVKFLLTRLYGKKARSIEYPNLNTIVDSNANCYKLDYLPSQTIQNACLSLGVNGFVPRSQLEEDVKKVLVSNELIEKGILDTSIMFEEIIRKFILETLGNDLRVPDTSRIGSGGGYEIHIKPVSEYNEEVLVQKLRTQVGEDPRLVLTRAFNKLVRQKLDEMLASCRVDQS